MRGLLHEACLIGGEWVTTDAWIEVDDPATGDIIGRVPRLGKQEARLAIDAAQAAMPEWAARPAMERANVLRLWSDLMVRHQEDLAQILTREQGKPIAEARAEIAYAASFLEWYGEEAKRIYGDIIPSHGRDKRIMVLKQPVGVVAAITPWNFPAAMVTRKVGPALAAGCAIVLKPAAQTPFTALAIGDLAMEAGLPPSLFSIITGPASEIGAEFTRNPLIRKITFTGSTRVGAKLMEQCAPTIKKVSLELGGNAPFIVFDDADIDAAVEGAIASKFRNAGQTCVCANRIYAQANIYDHFVEKLVAATALLKVGNGVDADTMIGPLIDAAAVEKVTEHIADAASKGAKVMCGGAVKGGRFFAPTVLSNVTRGMLVTTEETFGPLSPVIAFETDAGVIEQANATEFGLAAYFYTRDIGRIWKVAEALEVGIVGVNTGLISTAVAPFGGIKSSGLGREGSRYGIEDYVEIKYVCVGL